MTAMLTGTLASAVPVAFADEPPLRIDYHIELIDGPATQEPDGSWTVPVGERVNWKVTWTLVNPSTTALLNVRAADHFSGEIDVDPDTVDASQGDVTVAPVGGPNSATALDWAVGDLAPGAAAVLEFLIHTGLNAVGKQMYGDPGEYCLDSALTAKWRGGSLSLTCVRVHVKELPWLRVSLTNTRKEWRIRKPGDYASVALEVALASNRDVTVYFRGFGDLAYLAGSGADSPTRLPTFYAIGPSFAEASLAGWWSAEELNDQQLHFPSSDALRQGVEWLLWQRVAVSNAIPSSDYEDQATLVFTLANTAAAVMPESP